MQTNTLNTNRMNIKEQMFSNFNEQDNNTDFYFPLGFNAEKTQYNVQNSSIIHNNIKFNSFIYKPRNFFANSIIKQKEDLRQPTINNYVNTIPINFGLESSKYKAQKTVTSFSKRVHCNNSREIVFDKEKDLQYQMSGNSLKLIENVNQKKDLKLWMLFGPCLCNSNIKKKIKDVLKKYKRIYFLFDVIHFLKTQNDILLLKRIAIKETNNPNLFKVCNFELPTKEDASLFGVSLDVKKRKKDLKKVITMNSSINKNENCTNNDLINSKLCNSNASPLEKKVGSFKIDLRE